jgi:hypothetical protein
MGLALSACAPSGYVKTAYYGDLASLKKEIGEAKARRAIDRDGVVELARAVARRETRSVQGDEAIGRIRATRTCVNAVEPELRERAEAEDDAGAEALLVLFESGKIAKTALVDRYATSPSGALRAVAARGTTIARHAALRRSFFVDGDERVRQNAFRAAFEARDPADVPALLEAARLDPLPRNRSLAARAAGSAGGPSAVAGLRDVWAMADAEVRLSIVEAWGMAGAYSGGGDDAAKSPTGEDQLVQVAESGDSLASVAAAGELMRHQGAGASVGRAVIIRAIGAGTTDERLVAIQLAPLGDPDALAAIQRAAQEPRGVARVVALARLLESKPHRKDALARLAEEAKGTDAASRQARAALAASEDPSVASLLIRELEGADPGQRERAALGLFRLGRAVDMAGALADSDPDVRFSVACSVVALGEPRPG